MLSFRRGLLFLIVACLAACAQLKPRPPLPEESAVPPAEDTRLDQIIAPAEARHPGESAFRLVKDGPEAFVPVGLSTSRPTSGMRISPASLSRGNCLKPRTEA